VISAIESTLQRFSVPKLTEYVTHADRAGLEAYVDEVSAPSKFSIFWEMEQGPTMRLAGIPIESKFYLVGDAVIARGLFRDPLRALHRASCRRAGRRQRIPR
jgi:hypothetical protein